MKNGTTMTDRSGNTFRIIEFDELAVIERNQTHDPENFFVIGVMKKEEAEEKIRRFCR